MRLRRSKLLVLMLSMVVLCVSALYAGHRWWLTLGEDYRRKHLTSLLKEIPTVDSVQVTGYQNDLEYTIDEVTVTLNGSEPRMIALCCPDISLKKRLPVKQLGEIKLFIRNETQDFVSFPDFGTHGEFSSHMGLKISGVADLIENRESILEIISD